MTSRWRGAWACAAWRSRRSAPRRARSSAPWPSPGSTSHDTSADEIELLQSLADIAAIAIANARLYEQMTESGRRYRFLVDNSPDLIWTVDKDGSFTYLSETVRSLIGWGAGRS